MNIQGLITIDFDTTAELTAIATALSTLGVNMHLSATASGAPIDYIPPAPTQASNTPVDAEAGAPTDYVPPNKVYTRGNLHVGDIVHWKGAKYEFDGVVEKIAADATSSESKGVWVRRNDTGALVSLTIGNLATYGITILGTSSQPAPAATSDRITTASQAAVGQCVHWAGQVFNFDGKVIGVAPGDDKCVFLRRDDTGKKVSLTASDLLTGSLTRI